MSNSFGARGSLKVGNREYEIYRLSALTAAGLDASRLPYSLRVLLENLLRNEDGRTVKSEDIRALAGWDPKATPSVEIAFMPARVLLQDFTGVPAVVDLAAMRDAMRRMGGDPSLINPLLPAELVIDHSVQVDEAGHCHCLFAERQHRVRTQPRALRVPAVGAVGLRNFAVVPPDTGIVHQVNLEYLARVVFTAPSSSGPPVAYPDTVVGTDSHTTMINGLGVLGWGVGGIEAEAAMLGQAASMLIPQVVGFKLHGRMREGRPPPTWC
jgi:aconitate hydratase